MPVINPAVEKLVSGVKTVASLPTLYMRLNEMVGSASASNRDVANLISEDPGLAARLLRIANSSFYGYPSRIDTVTRAVTVIGTRQLTDIVLATSVVDMFEGIPREIVDMESFWRHSIACGVASRILASYRRELNVERHFVTGLLHDIGRLIIYIQMPGQARAAIDEVSARQGLLYEVENRLMGFDHAEVGGVLLQNWGLPESMVMSVTYHHRPSDYEGPDREVSIVHVAEIIANAMQMGSAGEQFVPRLDKAAWESLALPASVIAPTIKQLQRQYQDAVNMILFSSDRDQGSAAHA